MPQVKSTLSKGVKTALRFQRMQAHKKRKFHFNFKDRANFNTILADQFERKTLELTNEIKKGKLTEAGAKALGEHATLLEKTALTARNIRGSILRGETEKIKPLFETWVKNRKSSKPLSGADFVKFLDAYAIKQDKRAQGLLEAARSVPIRGSGLSGRRIAAHNLKS